MVNSMTKLIQDHGVPDTVISNGGPQYTSDKFQMLLKPYGLNHRLTSVTRQPHELGWIETR